MNKLNGENLLVLTIEFENGIRRAVYALSIPDMDDRLYLLECYISEDGILERKISNRICDVNGENFQSEIFRDIINRCGQIRNVSFSEELFGPEIFNISPEPIEGINYERKVYKKTCKKEKLILQYNK